MEDRMLGVVLWTDASDRKAVIWCEDHGNLAYYSEAETEHTAHCGVEIDAGDLIAFKVEERADMRKALQVQRLDAGFAPGIADTLRGSMTDRSFVRSEDNVVAFPASRR